MRRNCLLALVLCAFGVAVAVAARGQDNFRVLPTDFNADKTQQMMRSYLRRLAHEAFDRRRDELEMALTSEEALVAYQKKRRAFLRWTLGEMPEHTPLNARITGAVAGDGFTIEKLLFESQPGFYVTANLYRPAGNGPFPAILHPVGHAENGKAYVAYQQANQLLAQHGFLVLCYDPIGQGERKQIFDDDDTPTHRASGEHQQLGVAPILLGRGLASYMVWDGVRALDYLCSRADVDPQRIGCTGNSGGGNLTSYLMAYDDRIAAAAPGCFMTTHRRKNERPGPGDAEQNLFAQIRDGFDHPDFILARASKPTLILAATDDFVPIEGTWEAFRQAKRVYAKLGFPERVQLVEADAKHGFSRTLREAAVRFFARWLQGRQVAVFDDEQETGLLSEKELQVTATGQVVELDDARSIFDLFVERERQLAAHRPQVTRESIRRVTGIRPLEKLPLPKVEERTSSEQRSETKKQPTNDTLVAGPRKLVFRPESGVVLPALYWAAGDRDGVLIAPAAEVSAAVADAEKLNAAGHPVLVVNVRDSGETRTRNWRFFGADFYIAHMLGRCWLGMRSEDLLVCGRWLSQQQGGKSIRLAADGEIGAAALHAAALEPELFEVLQVRGDFTSWQKLMTSTEAHPHLHNAVHGALRYYDLKDLRVLLPDMGD